MPPESGGRLASLIPDAERVWLERTSHFAHVDTPEQVLAPVLRFPGSDAAPPRSSR